MTLSDAVQKMQQELNAELRDSMAAQAWATLALALVLKDFADDFRRVQMDIGRQTDKQLQAGPVGAFATPRLDPRVQQ